MSQPQDDDESEDQLFLEKQSHFRGRAKILLRDIQFEKENVEGGRAGDAGNVETLIQVYKLEGCLRLEYENSIPALVNEDVLARWVQHSGVSNAELLDFRSAPPFLRIDEPLVALDGKDQVEAARRFLDPFDQWWVVDLYSSELSHAAVLSLRAEYSHERGFTDGEIYRHLRHFQLNQDVVQAAKWLSRLSDSKRKDLKTFFSNHDAVRIALDDLLPFTGLWSSFQIGTLKRISSLNCEEVRSCPVKGVHLLNHVRRWFDTFASYIKYGTASWDRKRHLDIY